MNQLEEVLALVQISSVSRDEAALATHVEQILSRVTGLEVLRIDNNIVARTHRGRSQRIIIAGHLDTVPGDASRAHLDGEVLVGVGACDMKASLAVMMALAVENRPYGVDLTWVFYAKEEIARSESGIHEIAGHDPTLLHGDVAILAEPTNALVEAGCQGTLRAEVILRGQRAHTARPYMGLNALHRLGVLLTHVAAYSPRHVEIDGVEFVEQLQAVAATSGVAANVVPDEARVTLNHRFAPDRTLDSSARWLEEFIGVTLESQDSVIILDGAPAALPSLSNSHLSDLVALTQRPARAKVGWTDVATFAELGVPSTNFGAGDPLLAHHVDERVTAHEVEQFSHVLRNWLASR